jgi:excisionase family DNA binding protein
MEQHNEIMTLKDVAQYLRWHPRSVYRRLKTGEISAFKLGNHWRFSRAAIDKWVASLQVSLQPRRGRDSAA